jgi:methylmalonyl-CoA mutase
VAGNPKEHIDALKAAGVQGFVHIASDAVETLTEWQNRLGVN